MARGKVDLRRIDDRTRRLVKFSKRRSGLLKKARELAVLCDADVGVIVFSPKGKLSHYSSHSSLEKTIQRYKRFVDAERSVNNHALQAEALHKFSVQCVGVADQVTDQRVLKVAQRILGDGSIEQLNINDLSKLEEKLESCLRQVRSRKTELLMDFVTKLRKQERSLVCENRQLQLAMGDHDEGEVESSSGNDGNPSGSSTSAGSSNDASPPSPTLQLLGGA